MLTDLKLKNLKFNGKVALYADGDGLYLRVSKKTKRWQLSFMKDGKMRHFYGDYYPEVSLREAREWAEDTRKKSSDASLVTNSEFSIGTFLKQFRDIQVQNGRAEATIKKIDMRANKYLKDVLPMDVRDFTSAKAMAILEPIGAAKKYEAQAQTRELMKNIFLRPVVLGIIPANPIADLHKLLPSPKEISRAAILKLPDLGQLMRDLYNSTSKARIQTRLALRILPHLFVRSDNIYSWEWSEINFRERIWHIPAHKMKGQNPDPLDVPLSRQVMEILMEIKQVTGHLKYVFGRLEKDPATGREVEVPLAEHCLRNELISLGYFGAHMKDVPTDAKKQSAHGFRAIARTTMDEVLELRVDVIEHQLGHKVRDANGVAYNRTKHMEKRIVMMQLWSDFLDVLRTGIRKDVDTFIQKFKGKV